MPSLLSFTVIYLILAIVISSAISIYAWRKPRSCGNRAFVVACLMTTIWMLGDVIGRLSNSFTGEWIGEIIRYFGGSVLPVAILVFIYQYCGKEISRRQIKWLLVVPAISWLVMVTNPWHYLFFSDMRVSADNSMKLEYGIYFWSIYLPYSYGVFLVSFFKGVLEFSRASRYYRIQILFLLISLFVPFIVNVIGVFKLLGEFSYTSLSFPLFFSIMAYAIFRHQFLGSNPIAYETVFQSIRDGVLILDKHDIIRDINPAAAQGLGKEPSQVIGLHLREVFCQWETTVDFYDKNPQASGEFEISLFNSTRYFSIESIPLTAATRNPEGRVITIRDITDYHKHQMSLEALAFHDPLTRLANRRKFQEEVEQSIEKAKEKGEKLAILYFDLNDFKSVNDKLGHMVGDELLKYVAARVASILRKPDMLARLGGDEFGLLLHNCDENGVELVVERILENARRPFNVDGNLLVADLSIGVAFYPKHGKNLAELLRHADLAMYQAKQSGGGLSLLHISLGSGVGLEM